MRKKFLPFFILITICFLFSCDKKSQAEKDVAIARSRSYRSITVINKTSEKLMKECNLTTASGILIKHKDLNEVENIVFRNFDSENAFKNERELKIELIDRFDLKYEKVFSPNESGNTDVFITEKDLVKQRGNFLKRVERALNR